ncbi:MAG: extracellular solute-binding protein [Clostridia bacterium]|nr:extracellular solute-binding protein [Clostridia bacterium]
MKRTLALVLTLLIALCFTLPAMAVELDLPLAEDGYNVTIMLRKEELSQNTWPEKECVQYTEEQTGIHVEWIEIPFSAWDEKVNLTIASDDLPDAFIGSVDVVANMDILTPLDDLIDQYAPNTLEMFETLPDMRGALTLSDGHIYSLPTGDADPKNEVNGEMWINQTWLEQLGLEMPTTIDEFYDVLVAFRDSDPNGNGEQDEIPLLVSAASSNAARHDYLFGLFGTLENNQHVRVEDGQVIFTPAEDGYFEALSWLHKLYEEGLMNSEYYTEDYQQFLAKGHSETPIVGVVIEWYIDNIILSDFVSDYTVLPPLKDSEGNLMTWCPDMGPNSPQGTLNGFTITTACEHPELLVEWYDYINSNLDIQLLWNYGPEDLIWRYREDGLWELFNDNVPEGTSSSQIRRTMGTGPASPVYAYSRFRGPGVEFYANRIAAKVEANTLYKEAFPKERLSNGFGEVEEEAERNLLLVDIDNYLDQFKANAVVKGITEEEWQAHLDKLKSLNIEEYVGYWQSYFDSHQ